MIQDRVLICSTLIIEIRGPTPTVLQGSLWEGSRGVKVEYLTQFKINIFLVKDLFPAVSFRI